MLTMLRFFLAFRIKRTRVLNPSLRVSRSVLIHGSERTSPARYAFVGINYPRYARGFITRAIKRPVINFHRDRRSRPRMIFLNLESRDTRGRKRESDSFAAMPRRKRNRRIKGARRSARWTTRERSSGLVGNRWRTPYLWGVPYLIRSPGTIRNRRGPFAGPSRTLRSIPLSVDGSRVSARAVDHASSKTEDPSTARIEIDPRDAGIPYSRASDSSPLRASSAF